MSDETCNKNIEFKYCLNDENKVNTIEIVVSNPNITVPTETIPENVVVDAGTAKIKVVVPDEIDDISKYELPNDQIDIIYNYFTAGAAAPAEADVEVAAPVEGAVEGTVEGDADDDPLKQMNTATKEIGSGGARNSSLRKSARSRRRKSKTMSKRDYIVI